MELIVDTLTQEAFDKKLKEFLPCISRMVERATKANIHVDRIEILGGLSYNHLFRDHLTEQIKLYPNLFISFICWYFGFLHRTLIA